MIKIYEYFVTLRKQNNLKGKVFSVVHCRGGFAIDNTMIAFPIVVDLSKVLLISLNYYYFCYHVLFPQDAVM